MLADRAVCVKKKILFQVSNLYAGVNRAQNFINVRKPDLVHHGLLKHRPVSTAVNEALINQFECWNRLPSLSCKDL